VEGIASPLDASSNLRVRQGLTTVDAPQRRGRAVRQRLEEVRKAGQDGGRHLPPKDAPVRPQQVFTPLDQAR